MTTGPYDDVRGAASGGARATEPPITELEAAAIAVTFALVREELRADGLGERDGRTAVSAWADRAVAVRAPLRPGPDGWRRSAVRGRS